MGDGEEEDDAMGRVAFYFTRVGWGFWFDFFGSKEVADSFY